MKTNYLHISAGVCWIAASVLYLLNEPYGTVMIFCGIFFEILAWILIFAGCSCNSDKSGNSR